MTFAEARIGGTTEPGSLPRARKALSRTASIWYLSAVFGQALFLVFIVLFYYTSSLSGNFEAWDKKPNIEGFAPNDGAGNVMFALHVLLAAVMTLGGLVQLIPAIRQRWPKLHRWNGRMFMATALSLALGGLWLTWVRGTHLTVTGAVGISLNAVLIIGFSIMAWRAAVNRNFAQHRLWALRLFIVANAVWFMRLGYMIWGIATGGAGIGDAMNGPFDYFLAFGNSLLPLAIMEIYLRVQAGNSVRAHNQMAIALVVCALLVVGGSAAAWLGMWGPYV
jgi:Predicted membrane protein (DUF2306)